MVSRLGISWISEHRAKSFSDLAAYFGAHFNLTARGEPRHLSGTAVSPVFFPILHAHPMLGRTFLPEEDNYSAPRVVLLSYHLWSGVFRGDTQIVGRTISLNGDAFYVIGVMRPSFVDPADDETDLWVPLQQQIRPDRMLLRDVHFLSVVGRLRPGVTLGQTRADMNRIAAQLKMHNPTSDSGSGAVVMSLQKAKLGETGKSLLLALGIVILVLLIASSNVAILMLARASGRTREMAERAALGASRSSNPPRSVVRECVPWRLFRFARARTRATRPQACSAGCSLRSQCRVDPNQPRRAGVCALCFPDCRSGIWNTSGNQGIADGRSTHTPQFG